MGEFLISPGNDVKISPPYAGVVSAFLTSFQLLFAWEILTFSDRLPLFFGLFVSSCANTNPWP